MPLRLVGKIQALSRESNRLRTASNEGAKEFSCKNLWRIGQAETKLPQRMDDSVVPTGTW